MAASSNSSPARRDRDLLGQTVMVIGGSAGIGFETARLARAKGADIILTAREPDRLHRAGLELGASIAAFDATDFGRLGRFFDALPAPINHLLVTGPGPCRAPLAGFNLDAARRDVDTHLLLPLQIARHAAGKIRPAGTLLLMDRAGRPAAGLAFTAALTAALATLTRSLALEIAGPGQPDRGRPGRHAVPWPRCPATGSMNTVRNSAPSCRPTASSARPTSPPWPSTS